MEQLRLPIAAIQHLINYWRSGAIKFVSWQGSQTINTSRKTSDPTSFLALDIEGVQFIDCRRVIKTAERLI